MSNPFFDFDLLAFPTGESQQHSVEGSGQLKVLILSRFSQKSKEADYAFLENVLRAANLAPLQDKIFLLETEDKDLHLSLVQLSKKLAIEHILIFGLNVANLGIHARLPFYQFIALNGYKLMLAHDINIIREERAVKNNQKASALWQALKEQFLS